jgi:ELWxxDGT repeat protein/parallel beta-helix repeat protein
LLECRLLPSLSPILLKDINAGSAGSFAAGFTAVNSTVFFSANEGTHGTELWESSGSTAGTQMVTDLFPDFYSSYPTALTNVNGTLFFIGDDGHGKAIWETNGSATGTTQVSPPAVYLFGFQSLANVNGTLFFPGFDFTHGMELWKSNGSQAGTQLAADVSPGLPGSSPNDLTNVNGSLFFTAFTPTRGRELWVSNGTQAGTILLRDINSGGQGSGVHYLTNVNGTAFFSASDGTHGQELWKSNGTPAGTVLVKDINSGSAGAYPAGLVNVNGTLFFSASDGIHGAELWSSNGTAAGTAVIKDIDAGSLGSYPGSLTNVNGTLFFHANNGTSGIELWRSNGTAAGTTLVKDINPGPGNSSPNNLTVANGTLFFTATNRVSGQELWMSNGSALGTVLVRDIKAGTSGSYPSGLVNANGVLFFSADDGVHGREPWALGPLPAATKVATPPSGSGTSGPPVAGLESSRPGSSPMSATPPNLVVNQPGADDPNDGGGTLQNPCGMDGTLSLWEALNVAALNGGGTITFNAPMTISQTSSSPALILADDVTIDATSVESQGMPGVQISGGSGTSGFTLEDGDMIKGLVINGFAGAQITAAGTGDVIKGSFLGTDQSGTSEGGTENYGIMVTGDQADIGGTSSADRNVISGNRQANILIQEPTGSPAHGNLVEGNYVGTDASGQTAVSFAAPNDGIISAGPFNDIGGSAEGARNVISGNGGVGVRIHGEHDTVIGDYIGVAQDGTSRVLNKGDGISIDSGTGTVIGGEGLMASRNIISGNGGYGITVSIDANFTRIMGNYIGVGADGKAVRNKEGGIDLMSSNNRIGGSSIDDHNIISGNGGAGVDITGADARDNLVLGNYIGVDPGGSDARPNTFGIVISDGASMNTIGGPGLTDGNTISGNKGDGIWITGSSTVMNFVEGNKIGDLGGLLPTNLGSGVQISDGASQNTIGGVGMRNTISGGVRIAKSNSNTVSDNEITDSAVGVGMYHGDMNQISDNTIEQNFIGISVIGSQNDIGANFISNNTETGIEFPDTGSVSSGNAVIGNSLSDNPSQIVLSGTGVMSNLIGQNGVGNGNIIQGGTDGIIIENGTSDNGVVNNGINVPGRAVVIDGDGNFVTSNDITFSTQPGVSVLSGSGDLISQNSISSGGATSTLGILLGAGANDNQPAPLLTSALVTAGKTTISGVALGLSGASFKIEFFYTPGTGINQGASYLGFVNKSSGQTFSVVVNQALLSGHYTATETNVATLDTSEFSKAVAPSVMKRIALVGPASPAISVNGLTGSRPVDAVAGPTRLVSPFDPRRPTSSTSHTRVGRRSTHARPPDMIISVEWGDFWTSSNKR